MNILLVGGRPTVRYLIRELKQKNHQVTVIDPDAPWCALLANECEVPAYCGDGTSPSLLQSAGTERMELVVALQTKDAANLLVCELAKKQFHVPKTMALVSDPKNAELFQNLGVDRCLCVTHYIGDMIEQETIVGSFSRYLQIENGKISIFEVTIEEDSAAANRKLWELGLPAQSIVSCIIRGEQTIIPQGNTELKSKDRAILLSSAEAMEEAVTVLSGSKGKRSYHKIVPGGTNLF